ncbi:hypothetical protein QSJ19_23860 [Gordonia sp. ABSL11-1]|uniref:hypothetical protein n=1 Tax=Gordonia sp. ABSL11-1 TaxID=3053924 RepID=UPI0025735587|nr:hypothetical protein [Gordonia sp. ABSL11-1]MDL9948564.1 hypothetical protein [Gordonia sp. ABSL11-1]
MLVHFGQLMADQYFAFDLAWNSAEVDAEFTGSAVTPTGTKVWALSDTPVLQVWPSGEAAINQVQLGWEATNSAHAVPKWQMDGAISTALGAAQLVGTTAVTLASSYTLVLGDASRAVEVSNISPAQVTVPPRSSVAFPVGTVIELVQAGNGQVTLVAGSAVTLRTAGTLKDPGCVLGPDTAQEGDQ